MKYILAQTFGVLVTLVSLVSPQLKSKRKILFAMIIANVFSALSFFLLSRFAATGIGIVAIIQSIVLLLKSESEKQQSKIEIAIFVLLYISGGLLPYIINTVSFGLIDVLPIFGALLFMCAITQKQEQHMRLFLLFNGCVYFTYNLLIQSTQIFAQIVSIVSVIIALIRYRKK